MGGNPAVVIQGLVKAFGAEGGREVRVFSGLDLEVEEGELLCLLGPTGCGKTTLLRILAGFEPWENGEVRVWGKAPQAGKVPFALVFQQNTLFPWRRILADVALPLELKGVPRKEARARAEELLSLVRLHGVERAFPYELSGGMQQRAALARALAQEAPGLLMDEPFGALDDRTRRELQEALVEIHGSGRLTVVFVTHNIEEALSVADRAGVLHQGTFRQVGPLRELLRRPADAFTARFLCAGNLLEGTAEGEGPDPDTTVVRLRGADLVVPGAHRGALRVVLRPEDVEVRPLQEGAAPPPGNALPARVKRRFDAGRYVRLEIEAPFPLLAHVSHAAADRSGAVPGARVTAVLPRERLHVLER